MPPSSIGERKTDYAGSISGSQTAYMNGNTKENRGN